MRVRRGYRHINLKKFKIQKCAYLRKSTKIDQNSKHVMNELQWTPALSAIPHCCSFRRGEAAHARRNKFSCAHTSTIQLSSHGPKTTNPWFVEAYRKNNQFNKIRAQSEQCIFSSVPRCSILPRPVRLGASQRKNDTPLQHKKILEHFFENWLHSLQYLIYNDL